MQLELPGPIANSPLRLSERPVPTPGPGQVLLRVRRCGVCRTDLHIVEGEVELKSRPRVPGHQIVGVVEALGQGSLRFGQGDRVGVPWLYSTCGECRYCRRDKENLCENARFTGLDVDGGYGEFVVVDEAFACRLPPSFSDTDAAPLLCAGVIGYRALRLSEITPGGRIGLYGFGASAHIALQVAIHWGCDVWVATRTPEHRTLALDLGARWAGPAREMPRASLDAAVMFAPAGSLVPDALEAIAPGGTLSLAGIYMTPLPVLEYKTLYGERTMRTVANCTRQDVDELMALAGSIPIHVVTETFPLEEANRALLGLKASRISGSAVLTLDPPDPEGANSDQENR